MEKVDFRRTLKHLYDAKPAVTLVDVPAMAFVMVDGTGDPNTAAAYGTAIEWLYATSYAMKFASKAELGLDYVVPPLEGLWWSDDPQDFVARRKDRWHWTMMIMVPEQVTAAMFDAAVAKAGKKLGSPPSSLRLERFHEGPSLQMLHVGSYDDEGPALANLHNAEMPARGLTFNGHHHEIYLSDPRRVEPARLKTILRQPVKPA